MKICSEISADSLLKRSTKKIISNMAERSLIVIFPPDVRAAGQHRLVPDDPRLQDLPLSVLCVVMQLDL